MLNEFYSISQLNTQPIDEYQLENLGVERITMSWAHRIRDGYGSTTYHTNGITEKVKSEDYDGAFALKLTRVKPIYDLDKLINYHEDYYLSAGGSKDKFLKHIRYIILPYIQKYYANNKVCIELVEK